MKNNRLVFIGVVLIVFAVAFFFIERNGKNGSNFVSDIDNQLDNNIDINDDYIDIIIKTLDFISTTLSDFAEENTYQDYLIDENATKFKQFLEDTREIKKIKQSKSGSWKMADRELRTFSIEVLDDNIYEVVCRIYYELNAEKLPEPSFSIEGYKLLVSDKDEEFKVLAAMFSGYSPIPLMPATILGKPVEDFDLSIFIDDNFKVKSGVDMPYDLEQIKKELLK